MRAVFAFAVLLAIAASAPATAQDRVLILFSDNAQSALSRTSPALKRVSRALSEGLSRHGLDALDRRVVFRALDIRPMGGVSQRGVLSLSSKALYTRRAELVHSHVVVVMVTGRTESVGLAQSVTTEMTAALFSAGGNTPFGSHRLSMRQTMTRDLPRETALATLAAHLSDEMANWIAIRIDEGPPPPPAAIDVPEPPFTGHSNPMAAPIIFMVTFQGIDGEVLGRITQAMEHDFPHVIAARPPQGDDTIKRYGYISKMAPHVLFTRLHHLCNELGLTPGKHVTIDQPSEDKIKIRGMR